jgi:hypothetical protein
MKKTNSNTMFNTTTGARQWTRLALSRRVAVSAPRANYVYRVSMDV